MVNQKTLKQLIIEHGNDYGFSMEDIIIKFGNDILELDSLSVVIPYYETGEVFGLMLDNLYNSLDYVKKRASNSWNFEVIVVDDGSKKIKARKYVKNKFKEIRLIESKYNQGRTSSRNLGLDNAKYAKCLFIDSDVLVAREFLFYNLLAHAFAKKKIITVGFFQFVDKNYNIPTSGGEICCKDITLNDYRVDCIYGKTWIGCENDKKFIGKNFKTIKETDYFRHWPKDGFFGPWFLTNMVLGGFFIVDTQDAKNCNGFDPSFRGYGFTETSLPTKLIAGFGHYLVPITNGGCLHIDDKELNIPRKEKDDIFWDKHDFYFNHYLNLTWKQALNGYGKK